MRILSQFEIDRQEKNAEINREEMKKRRLWPCNDCKLRWHPRCMTFDHIDRKAATKNKNAKNLRSILYYNPEMFNRVLNGCSVVCMNCHSIRELRRDSTGPMISKAEGKYLVSKLEECTRGALIGELTND